MNWGLICSKDKPLYFEKRLSPFVSFEIIGTGEVSLKESEKEYPF